MPLRSTAITAASFLLSVKTGFSLLRAAAPQLYQPFPADEGGSIFPFNAENVRRSLLRFSCSLHV